MKKNGLSKLALTLLITGILLCVGVVLFVGIKGLGAKYHVTEYTQDIDESFENLSLESDISDLRVMLATDGKCRVVCKRLEKFGCTAVVENGTLVVRETDERKWYERISFFGGNTEAVIYLPEGKYGTLGADSDVGEVYLESGFSFTDIDLHTDTGHITVKGADAETVKVDTATGVITLVNVNCASVTVDSDTGIIKLIRVIATGEMNVESDTGSVVLDSVDAPAISVETDTGNVRGTILTPKTFTAESDTGRVNVPKDGNGGKCRIITDTGNITISIVK